MPIYIPLSDEILFQDPENIDDSNTWQQPCELLKLEKINTKKRRNSLQALTKRSSTSNILF